MRPSACRRPGLSDKVEIKFQDYRDETGKYDHIASIEMFEAVGEKYWPVFFGKVKDCLNPGGSAGMQIITINDKILRSLSQASGFHPALCVSWRNAADTGKAEKPGQGFRPRASIAKTSSRRIMPGRSPNGANASGVPGTSCATWASMAASRSSGSSISSIARRGSGPNISMCARCSTNHDNRYAR